MLHRSWALYGAVCVALALPGAVRAATPLGSLDVSSDVTVNLAGEVADDEDLWEDDLSGGVSLLDLGPLPASADLNGAHDDGVSAPLLSLDVTTNLPGAGVTRPADVASWDGRSYAIEFDAAAEGIAPGARVDAVGRAEGGDLLLSFDVTVDLRGIVADDEDLVRYDAARRSFSMFFDGSSEGIAGSLDLDGAAYLVQNGHLLLSFDTGGSIGGFVFADEDVLEFDPGSGSFELIHDGSAQGLGAADLDAVSTLPFMDSDGDEIPDGIDNCTEIDNPGQEDDDRDGFGNPCDCDFTNDGFCNIDDFNIFLPDFLSGRDAGRGTDMSGDGFVNIDDFNLFLPGFLRGTPGPAGTSE